MPDKKISQMDPDTSLDGSEAVPVVQNGNKRTTTQAIANLAPPTNLTYDAATRELSSSTGEDVTIPLVNTTAAGLVPHTWLTGAEVVTLEHIHGNIAGEVYEHVKAGASLSALTPYRIIGGVGDTDRVEVVAADAGNSNTMPASGILPGALASNADGHGTVAGVITGVNTAAYPPGTVLYVAVGGGLTATKPSANVQMVAVVGRQHASTGTVVPLIGPSLALSAYTGAYGDLTGLPMLGSAAAAATTDFAPAAQGVTNGSSHNHDGGDGAQIAYGSLSGLPGNFTSSTAGLVPASGGGTSNFLRADGTFAAPPGGAGTPGGTSGQAQFNNAGAFGGAAGLTIDPATGRLALASFLAAASAPATPASAGFVLYAAPTTGALSLKGGNGFVSTLNATGITADRSYQFQDKSGTLAHLDDLFDGYAVGNWIQPIPGTFGNTLGSPPSTIHLFPFYVLRSISVNELAARVNTAVAASTFQLAIYGSVNGLPSGTPLATTVDLSGATAANLSASVTPFNLIAGRIHFMASNVSASTSNLVFLGSTTTGIGASNVLGVENLAVAISAATSVGWCRSVSQTYGTWPDLTGVTTLANQNQRCPAIFLKVSAFI
jgi:hypothetical protein